MTPDVDFLIHSVSITEGTDDHLNIVVSLKDDEDTVFGYEDVHFERAEEGLALMFRAVAHTRRDDESDESLQARAEALIRHVVETSIPELGTAV